VRTHVEETPNGEVSDDTVNSAATVSSQGVTMSTNPGINPPVRPSIGTSDNGIGEWAHVPNRGQGADFQERATGITRNPDGSTTEYRVPYKNPNPRGRNYVDFDGHVWRGQPPQQFLQDAKKGYKYITYPNSYKGKKALQKLVAQANKQLAAIHQSGSDAQLEWAFSDKDAADFMQAYFDRNKIPINVCYVP
jgi:hypothetical protein